MELTVGDLQPVKAPVSVGTQVRIVVEGEKLSGVVRAVHLDGFVAVGVSRLSDAGRDNYTEDIYRIPVSELK